MFLHQMLPNTHINFEVNFLLFEKCSRSVESSITLIFQVEFVLLESANSFVSHSNMKGDLQFLLIFTLEGHNVYKMSFTI